MRPRLIIVGGGLAGGLSALALATRRPEIDLVLIEGDMRFGGNHVWSFFDDDIAPDARWLTDMMKPVRWPAHRVSFPARRRRLSFGYNSIRSADLHDVLMRALPPAAIRLGRDASEVTANAVVLSDGERIGADGVIDARGAGPPGGLELGWQKFVGRHIRCAEPHGRDEPMIMDALVDQSEGYRFVYTLPFSDRDLLVEDTYYTLSPALDVTAVGDRISAYLAAHRWTPELVLGEETGILPIVIGGSVDSFWEGRSIAQIGMRGGFFHPTTGYSLPDAVRNAILLTRQASLETGPLYGLMRRRAAQLWKERGFYRMLNRLLFHAAAPEDRYRILEHFYRLPESTISRFYGGSANGLDKLRTLSGKPPVPIGRAIAALKGRS